MSEVEKAPYIAKVAQKWDECDVTMTAYKKKEEMGVQSATPKESEKSKFELNEDDEDDKIREDDDDDSKHFCSHATSVIRSSDQW